MPFSRGLEQHLEQTEVISSHLFWNWNKIITGVLLAIVAILFISGILPGVNSQAPYTFTIGIGVYWMGITLCINGLFTESREFYLLKRQIEELSEKLNNKSL